MELLDDRSNARVRRDVSQLWSLAKNVVSAANEFSKVYGIFRTEKKGGAPADFKEESKRSILLVLKTLNKAFGILTNTNNAPPQVVAVKVLYAVPRNSFR